MRSTNRPRKRHQTITIHTECPGASRTRATVPREIDPHTIVQAAWGGVVPAGVVPSRVERNGVQLAIYDPMQNLSAGGVDDGDVLVCEHDTGQQLGAPSMLQAYRAMHRYAASNLPRACEFGHVAVT